MKDNQFACEEHGVQVPIYNYVLNAYLDDGTGNIRTIFWKQQSQRLLKITDKDFDAIRMQPETFEKYKTDLLGAQVKVLGTAKNNIMGRMEFNADVVFVDLNPDHEVEMLDHMREVALDTQVYSNVNKDAPAAAKSETKPKENIVKSTDVDDEFEVSEDFLE